MTHWSNYGGAYRTELLLLEQDAREALEDEMQTWGKCANCGEVNHPAEDHCWKCGEYIPLYIACPACGQQLHPPEPHSCGKGAQA